MEQINGQNHHHPLYCQMGQTLHGTELKPNFKEDSTHAQTNKQKKKTKKNKTQKGLDKTIYI